MFSFSLAAAACCWSCPSKTATDAAARSLLPRLCIDVSASTNKSGSVALVEEVDELVGEEQEMLEEEVSFVTAVALTMLLDVVAMACCFCCCRSSHRDKSLSCVVRSAMLYSKLLTLLYVLCQ